MKKGETAAGQADIAASKTIKDVAEEMTSYVGIGVSTLPSINHNDR